MKIKLTNSGNCRTKEVTYMGKLNGKILPRNTQKIVHENLFPRNLHGMVDRKNLLYAKIKLLKLSIFCLYLNMLKYFVYE